MLRSTEATIWMAQADHLSGEALGAVVPRLFELGAKNAQIVPTITKKNRPGHVIFVDTVADNAVQGIEHFFVRELGITGFHRWKSEHVHTPTERLQQTILVTSGPNSLSVIARLKQLTGLGTDDAYIRIEHDSALEVQKAILDEFGYTISLREIAFLVESSVFRDETEAHIDLNGCGNSRCISKEVSDG